MARRSYIGSWFKSGNQRERENRIYRKLMYPFGEEQGIWEEEALGAFLGKKDVSTYRYILLLRREVDIRSKLDEDDDNYDTYESSLAEYEDAVKLMRIKDDDKKIIELISDAESGISSIEDLPSIEELKQMIKQG